MKMFSPRIGTPTVVAITVVVLLSLISIPGVYSFNYHAARGQRVMELLEEYQVSWADLPLPQREGIRQLATQAGKKYSVLMLLGQYLPISLLIILAVCMISKSASIEFRRFSRKCFFAISVIGMFFLSLAHSSYGVGDSFAESFGISLFFYLVVGACLWGVIGIGVLIRGKCAREDEKQPIQEKMLGVQSKIDKQQKQPIQVEETSSARGVSDEGVICEWILNHERQANWIAFSIIAVIIAFVIYIIRFSNTPAATQADIPSHQQYQNFSTPSSQLISHSGENGLSSRDSRFALIRLPLGISIEVPKNWQVLNSDINTTIETAEEAAGRIKGIELPAVQKVNLFRANSNPRTTYAAIAINATDSEISPDELLEASEAEIRELSPLMHQMIEQGLAIHNCRIIRFDGIAREIFDGHPALVISYVRSGPNGSVVVQMTRLFMDDKEISLNLSYRLNETQLWKPVIEYMKTTFRIAAPKVDTRSSD